MLLELSDATMTSSRAVQPTAPDEAPGFIPPSVIRPVVSTSGVNGSVVDKEQPIDGVRILDGIAPLERARYFRHAALSSRLEVLQSWEGAVDRKSTRLNSSH